LNDCLDNLSSCDLIAIASFFSIIISQGLTSTQIGTLSCFFSAVGDNLGIISSNEGCPNTSNEEQ
jgi:hypothetical protein